MRNSGSDVFIVIARSNIIVPQMRVHCSSINLQIGTVSRFAIINVLWRYSEIMVHYLNILYHRCKSLPAK